MEIRNMRQGTKAMIASKVLGSIIWWVALSASAELALITHPNNSQSQLSLEEVRHIYLGQTNELPDGANVTPVDQKDGSQTKTEFQSKVLQKDPGQIKAIWSKLIFTSGRAPPFVLASDAEVKTWVAKTPGSLGYINKAAVDNSVKVLLVVP